ncbi:hypothetical protein AQJ46_00005 [Streptomyces canus]|uniref:Uncharacterized protein n=1 Tax=Streptomyces canus TaxID=58343 RepID=A0A101SHR4_9ACTN|nr:hypothetical protein AQJ46_00005 [Streptomyces canus]
MSLSADGAGWTPLHFAAQAQEPVIVEELLAAGVSVDVPDGQGNTALWRAVFSYRGDPAVLRLLLAAGRRLTRATLASWRTA